MNKILLALQRALRLIICDEPPPPVPTIRRSITGVELLELLQKELPPTTRFVSAGKFLSDIAFDLCDLEDIQEFLQQDNTNHYTFKDEKFDCDNFTYRLMGQFNTPAWASIAKGIVWTDKHALMFCIDANLDFWWIEPQNDNAQSELKPWQGSTIRFILI